MKKACIDQNLRNQIKLDFSNFIKSKNMRNTPERIAILDKVLEQSGHFEIDHIHTVINAEFHVSRATIYNTFELLCESGILRKNCFLENMAVYELSTDKHLHLVCYKCGSIKEIRDERALDHIYTLKFRGFHTTLGSVNIYGICSACSRKIKKFTLNSNTNGKN